MISPISLIRAIRSTGQRRVSRKAPKAIIPNMRPPIRSGMLTCATETSTPNIGGFGDCLRRKIVGQGLKYDHLAREKLAVIPYLVLVEAFQTAPDRRPQPRWRTARRANHLPGIQRRWFDRSREILEFATVPFGLPSQTRSPARFANCEERSTSRRSNASNSSADASDSGLVFAGLLNGITSAMGTFSRSEVRGDVKSSTIRYSE